MEAFHHMLQGHFQYLDKEQHSPVISHSQTLPVEMVFLYKVTLTLLVSSKELQFVKVSNPQAAYLEDGPRQFCQTATSYAS